MDGELLLAKQWHGKPNDINLKMLIPTVKEKILVASFIHRTSTHYSLYRKINSVAKVDGGLSPEQSGILNLMYHWVVKKRDSQVGWRTNTYDIFSFMHITKKKGKVSLICQRYCGTNRWLRKAVRAAHWGIQLENLQLWKVDLGASSKVAQDDLPPAVLGLMQFKWFCASPWQKVYLLTTARCTQMVRTVSTKHIFSVSSPAYGTLRSYCTHLLWKIWLLFSISDETGLSDVLSTILCWGEMF